LGGFLLEKSKNRAIRYIFLWRHCEEAQQRGNLPKISTKTNLSTSKSHKKDAATIAPAGGVC